MKENVVDSSQIIGEVKERNRFYLALLRIREIAEENSKGREFEVARPLDEIANICEKVLGN